MTQEMIKGLNDTQLEQAIAWAQDEQKTRSNKKKQDAIAKIRELARTAGISVHIDGTRGRPLKTKEN